MSEYRKMLKDSRWQKLRLRIFERDDWTCQACLRKNVSLEVHHWRYEAGAAPWEANAAQLETLCEDCHAQAEAAIDEVHRELKRKNLARAVVRNWAPVRRDLGQVHLWIVSARPEADADELEDALLDVAVKKIEGKLRLADAVEPMTWAAIRPKKDKL